MDTNISQPDKDELAGDLLVGREAIRDYLAYLGMPGNIDVYRLKREGKWPIGKTSGGDGGSLIASKKKLARYAQRIAAPAS